MAVTDSYDRARSATRRWGSGAQVLLAWCGSDPAPVLGDAVVRPTFPDLGAAYAVNRCLELAAAPVVVVAAGRVPVALDREELLDAGGLDQALPLPLALLEARLRGRAIGQPLRTAGRRLARVHEQRPSSRRPLAGLPAVLGLDADALVPLAASARAKNHLMYKADRGRVLHLYADPSERLQRGVAERERLRRRVPAARVPRLHAAAAGQDCLWVLEDEVQGPALSGPPVDWWTEATGWLAELAGPPGRPLEQTPDWPVVVQECVRAVPDPSRSRAARALQELGRWPARHQHGDLQPKNVVRTPAGLAAVDWEGVWLEGLVGLDLLFLALLASSTGPDPTLLARLHGGGDAADRPVLPTLQRLGVSGADVAVLVEGCLALWTRGEARRASQLGAPLTRRQGTFFTEQWARLPSPSLRR